MTVPYEYYLLNEYPASGPIGTNVTGNWFVLNGVIVSLSDVPPDIPTEIYFGSVLGDSISITEPMGGTGLFYVTPFNTFLNESEIEDAYYWPIGIPGGIELSPCDQVTTGGFTFVCQFQDALVSVNNAPGQGFGIPVGNNPCAMVADVSDPFAQYLYVANYSDVTVSVIELDPSSPNWLTVVATIPVTSTPSAICYAGGYVFVACFQQGPGASGSDVDVIDPTTLTVVASINDNTTGFIPLAPVRLVPSPDGSFVWVLTDGQDVIINQPTVMGIRVSDFTTYGPVQLTPLPTLYQGAYQMVYMTGDVLLATVWTGPLAPFNTVDANVYVIDVSAPTTPSLTGYNTVATSGETGPIATYDGTTAYMTVTEGPNNPATLFAVDSAGAVLWSVEVDGNPFSLGVNGSYVYVGNRRVAPPSLGSTDIESPGVVVVDISAMAISTTFNIVSVCAPDRGDSIDDAAFTQFGPLGGLFIDVPNGLALGLYEVPLGYFSVDAPTGTGTVLLDGATGISPATYPNWLSFFYFTYTVVPPSYTAPRPFVPPILAPLSPASMTNWRALAAWTQSLTTALSPFSPVNLGALDPVEATNWRDVANWTRTLVDAGFIAGDQPLTLTRLRGLPDETDWRALVTWSEEPSPLPPLPNT